MGERKNTWRHLARHEGPWAWSGDQLLAVRPDHSEPVLVVHDEIWAPNDADKTLIAAAPELLEALRKWLVLYESANRSSKNANSAFVDARDLEAFAADTRAAIAKATSQ